ncbi:MAG TPA: SCO family protein [Planctomycetota bacterium]|nr:SCO family protein [Planctomycetota bacterium]
MEFLLTADVFRRLGTAVGALAILGAQAPAGQARGGTPGVGITQQLGSSVTMDLQFRDERGNPISLGEASAGKPFVLALVYYRCPMLCNLVLGGILETLVALEPDAGDRFSVVTVSFDPSEGPDLASAKKQHYLRAYGRPSGERGWRFLSDRAGSAERLCRETGFRVSFDPVTRQYAHASAILVLTPDGRISRYLMGVTYPARDLRLALVEASAGKIGTATDQLLLLCLQYDPRAGKYTLAVWKLLRIGAAVTVFALLALILVLSRKRVRGAVDTAGAPAPRTAERV